MAPNFYEFVMKMSNLNIYASKFYKFSEQFCIALVVSIILRV